MCHVLLCNVLSCILYCTVSPGAVSYTVSVLGRDKGYTVKYSLSPEGFSEGFSKGDGLNLTVYPKSSPNMDTK